MGLEIVGPGFGRTGTSSMKAALERLGFGPCHHMRELIYHPSQLPIWQAALRGEPMDWCEVFAGYRAQMDLPGAYFWREIAAAFPEAKVILTVRPPEQWYASAQATIFALARSRDTLADPRHRGIAALANSFFLATFDGHQDDRDHALAIYSAHIAEVQALISPKRLLTFDVAEGWEPLCAFLGAAVPDEPFPARNARQQFVEEKKVL